MGGRVSLRLPVRLPARPANKLGSTLPVDDLVGGLRDMMIFRVGFTREAYGRDERFVHDHG